MNIGFHGYEPAFESGNMMTSTGSSHHLITLMNEFARLGHYNYWFGNGENSIATSISLDLIPNMNIIFLFWRWPMPDYPDRDTAYSRQLSIIKRAANLKIPIVVHDQDHKIDDKMKSFLTGYAVRLTEPSLHPRLGFESLMYPSSYSLTRKYQPHSRFGLAYIGNNYERYEQAKKYVVHPRVLASFYGNWVIKSPSRETPEQVEHDFPNVLFEGRLEADQVVTRLANASATIHLAKPSYNETGFITMRWAEAASAACPALIPSEFKFLESVPKIGFVADSQAVAENLDILEALKDPNHGKAIVEWQREFVNQYMKPDRWVELAVEANDFVTPQPNEEGEKNK